MSISSIPNTVSYHVPPSSISGMQLSTPIKEESTSLLTVNAPRKKCSLSTTLKTIAVVSIGLGISITTRYLLKPFNFFSSSNSLSDTSEITAIKVLIKTVDIYPLGKNVILAQSFKGQDLSFDFDRSLSREAQCRFAELVKESSNDMINQTSLIKLPFASEKKQKKCFKTDIKMSLASIRQKKVTKFVPAPVKNIFVQKGKNKNTSIFDISPLGKINTLLKLSFQRYQDLFFTFGPPLGQQIEYRVVEVIRSASASENLINQISSCMLKLPFDSKVKQQAHSEKYLGLPFPSIRPAIRELRICFAKILGKAPDYEIKAMKKIKEYPSHTYELIEKVEMALADGGFISPLIDIGEYTSNVGQYVIRTKTGEIVALFNTDSHKMVKDWKEVELKKTIIGEQPMGMESQFFANILNDDQFTRLPRGTMIAIKIDEQDVEGYLQEWVGSQKIHSGKSLEYVPNYPLSSKYALDTFNPYIRRTDLPKYADFSITDLHKIMLLDLRTFNNYRYPRNLVEIKTNGDGFQEKILIPIDMDRNLSWELKNIRPEMFMLPQAKISFDDDMKRYILALEGDVDVEIIRQLGFPEQIAINSMFITRIIKVGAENDLSPFQIFNIIIEQGDALVANVLRKVKEKLKENYTVQELKIILDMPYYDQPNNDAFFWFEINRLVTIAVNKEKN